MSASKDFKTIFFPSNAPSPADLVRDTYRVGTAGKKSPSKNRARRSRLGSGKKANTVHDFVINEYMSRKQNESSNKNMLNKPYGGVDIFLVKDTLGKTKLSGGKGSDKH